MRYKLAHLMVTEDQMNPNIKQFWDLNRMYTPLRKELMDTLTDDDLALFTGRREPDFG